MKRIWDRSKLWRNKLSNEVTVNGSNTLINLESLTKTYKSAADEFSALKNINLQVQSGELVSVIGKSGSGKSTLLNMITGIDRPTSGQVWVSDTPVHLLNEEQLAVWRGANIGIIFQFFQLLPTLTVLENVILPMDFAGRNHFKNRIEQAMALLEQMELADQSRKFPSALSGGQQQRVAIARSLANDPAIIVADEPTGNLDSKTARSIFSLFEKLVDSGRTILTVTHDQDLAKQATHTITLADGEIVDEVKHVSLGKTAVVSGLPA